MRRLIFLLSLALSLALIGCGERASLSPTPFPTTGPTETPGGGGPVPLTVIELMSAPGLYRDALVQVTGQLRKQPIVVCDSEYHPSPAGWGLGEEGVLAPAGGFDQQVRSLLPDSMQMTVEGRWRRWEGLVGCGKQAVQKEVWYLETGRIISPSPLTQVTLTPATGVEIVAITGEPTLISDATIEPTLALEATPTLPESTGGSAALASPTLDPFAGQTVVPPPTQVLQPPTVQGTPSPTLPVGTPGTLGTPTVTGTVTPAGTPTPTVTGTPPTPTPTATGGSSGQVVEKGDISEVLVEDFVVSNLAGGVIDSWDLDMFEDESLFLYVVAPSPADIMVSLLKDGQPLINRQNTAPVGSSETISNPTLQGEGRYEIQVLTNGGVPTDYAIAIFSDTDVDAPPFTVPGTLSSGSPRSGVALASETYHYWFFSARAGDDLTAVLTPLAGEDPYFTLYTPDGDNLEDVDLGLGGEEEIIEVTIEADGLYALLVGEAFGEPLNYNVGITLQ